MGREFRLGAVILALLVGVVGRAHAACPVPPGGVVQLGTKQVDIVGEQLTLVQEWATWQLSDGSRIRVDCGIVGVRFH